MSKTGSIGLYPLPALIPSRRSHQNQKAHQPPPTPSSFPRTRESTNLGMDSGSPPHSTRNDGAGFTKMSKAQGIGVYPWSAPIPSRRSHQYQKAHQTPPTPTSFPRTRESINLGMDSRPPPHSTRYDNFDTTRGLHPKQDILMPGKDTVIDQTTTAPDHPTPP